MIAGRCCKALLVLSAALLISEAGPIQVAEGAGSMAATSASPDCASAPLRSTGTVRYFCNCDANADPSCRSGRDGNRGTTASSPKKSWEAIQGALNSMAMGDTIALCMGGSWSNVGPLKVSARCAASPGTCDIRSYVPTWATASTDRPRLEFKTESDALNVDNASFVRIWNLELRQTCTTPSCNTLFVRDDSRNLDVCNVNFDGGYLPIAMAPSGTDNLNITVRNNQISNAYFTGFFGGGPNVSITGNTFTNNGLNPSSPPQMHSVYLIGHSVGDGHEQGAPWDGNAGTLPLVFSNNQLKTDSRCGGVMAVVHGVFKNTAVIMENNHFSTLSTDGNCFGIQIAAGNSGSYFNKFVLRRNHYIGTGNAAGVEVNCCLNCTVTDNLVDNGSLNIGDAVGSCTNGASASTNLVENNSIYLASGNRTALTVEGGGHVVTNNAVWANGNACSVSGDAAVNANNYCRKSGGDPLEKVFVNAARGDFTPTRPGPLVGAGNATYYSLVAIGSALWSPSDPGVVRRVPIDIGALK